MAVRLSETSFSNFFPPHLPPAQRCMWKYRVEVVALDWASCLLGVITSRSSVLYSNGKELVMLTVRESR